MINFSNEVNKAHFFLKNKQRKNYIIKNKLFLVLHLITNKLKYFLIKLNYFPCINYQLKINSSYQL